MAAKQYLDLHGLGVYDTAIKSHITSEINTKVGTLDTSSDVTLASKTNDIITLTGSMKEEDGVIAKGSGTDVVLAKVSATGLSSDVQYKAASGQDPAVSVEDALDDIYDQIGAGGSVSEQTIAILHWVPCNGW